jgi:hypothetical protein
MLPTLLTRAAGRMLRRRLGRLGGEDALAWAIRLPLVTLVIAGAVALLLHRPR